MLEIILLIFLTRNIGKIALQKGQKPGTWKWRTVLAWIVCEIIGVNLFMSFFNVTPDDLIYSPDLLIKLMFFSLFSAFGGYLIIRAILTNKPDVHQS